MIRSVLIVDVISSSAGYSHSELDVEDVESAESRDTSLSEQQLFTDRARSGGRQD